jgi:hypothetical protein
LALPSWHGQILFNLVLESSFGNLAKIGNAGMIGITGNDLTAEVCVPQETNIEVPAEGIGEILGI